MKNKRNTKYEGMGFVEALIAIMVVGASSVVLMQIAVRTMQDMVQDERLDKMTQYAVEGATMAQEIANMEKATGEELFPNESFPENSRCYVLEDSVSGSFYFRLDESGTNLKYYNYSAGEYAGESYRTEAVLNSGKEDSDSGKFFRLLCIDKHEENPKYIMAKVIIGLSDYDGTITKGNNVKDYTYFTVINL